LAISANISFSELIWQRHWKTMREAFVTATLFYLFFFLVMFAEILLVFLQKRNNFNQGRRKLNGRAYRAQQEDSIRRTVYVSDIDQHVCF